MAGRMVAGTAEVFRLAGHKVQTGASIGLAVAPTDGSEVIELMRAADVAMYRAKEAGRGTFRFFEPAMDADMRDRTELSAELREAITDGQVVPFYQPLVDFAEGKVRGFEALARWRHPVRGLIQPATFMPIAEDLNLVGPLSLSLLRHVCADAAGWAEDFRVAIKMPSSEFRDPIALERFKAIVLGSRIAPGRFEIELTESALIGNFDAAQQAINGLREIGMTVALDEFGAGLSSLCHLHAVRFDRVKIERSFIGSVTDGARGAEYVAAMIGLTRSLHVEVVADGVESAAVLAKLGELGCHLGQGFLFTEALPGSELLMAAERLQLALQTGVFLRSTVE